MSEAVQDRYAPSSICFGCGPANKQGLRIKSHWERRERGEGRGGEEVLVMRFRPEPHHQAFPGMLNGGIAGALLDCHGNWCAATTIMRERGDAEPPCTVTAEFHVKLKRPTPVDVDLEAIARPIEVDGDRVVVEAELRAGDKVTATCRGVFVAVKPGHPAYHRWG